MNRGRKDLRQLGGAAEALVAAEMVRRGYRVIGRNVAVEGGEIDLVARNAREVVIVEVRSRRGGGADDPTDSIGRGKRVRVRRTAASWLDDRPVDYEEVRLFAGVVRWKEDGCPEVSIVEDAF